MDLDRELDLNLQRARAVTRRQFLKHSQTGLGAIALSMLLDGEGARRIDPRSRPRPRPGAHGRGRQPDGGPAAALPGQGQAGDLPAHVGRAAPAGSVRLQADAGQAQHAALPRRAAQEPAVRVHQGASRSCWARRTSSTSTARAASRSAISCRISARSSMTSRSSGRCTPTSSTTHRPSSSSSPAAP